MKNILIDKQNEEKEGIEKIINSLPPRNNTPIKKYNKKRLVKYLTGRLEHRGITKEWLRKNGYNIESLILDL